MFKDKVERISIALKTYIVFTIFIISVAAVGIILAKQSPIEAAAFSLIGIGVIVLAIGLTLVVIADLQEDVPFTIFKDERVQIRFEEDTPKFFNYLFNLKNKTKVIGEIDVKTGPFDFLIAQHFGWAPFPQLHKSKEYVRFESLQAEKKEFGPLDMEAGDYCASFYKKTRGDLKATFQLKGTFLRKPYEKWYNLGCTLLEISIPIIVTGLVLLA